MLSPFARKAITLGLLAAVGPFAIDMYLPALPAIAEDLQVSTSAAQMTLMAFFIAFGLSQIVYGPASDALGRKPPLYFGLTLFLIGSIGCAFAPTIGWLIFGRVVQGLGAAAVMVIPRAIVRDLYSGVEATRMMSTIMLVFSVSPILAPTIGGWLISFIGWRAIFIAVGVVTLIGLALVRFVLRETWPAQRRVSSALPNILANYRMLLGHRRFLGLTFIGGFGMSSFFTFLASSSFIYINHFGLTASQFGLAFGVNAIGFIGASQFAAPLAQRFGSERVVAAAVTGYLLFALALFAATLAGADNLYLLMAQLFFCFAFLGLVVPSTMVLALDDHGPIAGMASALGGTLQMVMGASIIGLGSFFFNGTALPMAGVIAACSVCAFILARGTLSGARPQTVTAS